MRSAAFRRGEGFRAVVFDCDSTLAAIEGIDELATGRAAEIRALTDAAMDGSVPLEEVYGRRLTLLRPTRDRVDALGKAYVAALVEDAAETVAALLWLGKAVRVVSGGLRPPVEALARHLGIAREAVMAVGIEFDEAGEYAGFEERSPLARNGGKTELLAAWDLPRPSLLVGDGVTDREARPSVDAFAAYTGVVRREAAVEGADVVLSSRSLAPVLSLAADDEDRARLVTSRWAALLALGDRLLSDSPTRNG